MFEGCFFAEDSDLHVIPATPALSFTFRTFEQIWPTSEGDRPAQDGDKIPEFPHGFKKIIFN